MNEVTLPEMLEAREHRVMLQQHMLSAAPGALICLTLNIPGPHKVFEGIPFLYDTGCQRIRNILSDEHIEITDKVTIKEKTGYEAYYAVDAEADVVKKLMVTIEDQDAIGRLFDIDIIKPDGYKVSREELGLPGRRCLLCGESAQVCARSRRHSVDELIARIKDMLREASSH